MSTYNGEKYLSEQIESILRQKDVDLELVIRDDGSNDETPSIIRKYAKLDKRIIPLYGQNIGFRKSFFSTLVDSVSDKYDYYAFSDQDDVWLEDKLSVAIDALDKIEGTIKLYTSSLNVVDQNLQKMYINSFNKLKISYGSALSRQRLAGCTMVFDKQLASLCGRLNMCNYPNKLISHDGAVYYICLACGGNVYFDINSHINFRRHVNTETEHGKGFKKRLDSITNIFGENKNNRYLQNKMINDLYGEYMPKVVKELSDNIIGYKESFRERIKLAFNKEIRCNIFPIDVAYFIAILFGFY